MAIWWLTSIGNACSSEVAGRRPGVGTLHMGNAPSLRTSRTVIDDVERHTMYARALILAGAVGMLGSLTGCYESADVTMYKPGVYKGVNDPLLVKQRSPEQQETLRERFSLGQLDR
jgi:hypothetical protein